MRSPQPPMRTGSLVARGRETEDRPAPRPEKSRRDRGRALLREAAGRAPRVSRMAVERPRLRDTDRLEEGAPTDAEIGAARRSSDPGAPGSLPPGRDESGRDSRPPVPAAAASCARRTGGAPATATGRRDPDRRSRSRSRTGPRSRRARGTRRASCRSGRRCRRAAMGRLRSDRSSADRRARAFRSS